MLPYLIAYVMGAMFTSGLCVRISQREIHDHPNHQVFFIIMQGCMTIIWPVFLGYTLGHFIVRLEDFLNDITEMAQREVPPEIKEHLENPIFPHREDE